MSKVRHLVCQVCGLQNEFIGARTIGDYTLKCQNCGALLSEPPPVQRVTQTNHLELRHIPNKGLGVFAGRAYQKDALVDRSPAYRVDAFYPQISKIELEPYDDSLVSQNLSHMLFPWSVKGKKTPDRCMVLGYGMLFNHHPNPNLYYQPYVDPETKRRYIDFYAERDIAEGEELCHHYTDNSRLWFRG